MQQLPNDFVVSVTNIEYKLKAILYVMVPIWIKRDDTHRVCFAIIDKLLANEQIVSLSLRLANKVKVKMLSLRFQIGLH